MEWVDPSTVVLVVLVATLVFIVGRLRREPPSLVAMNTIGTAIFFFGIRWAIGVGEEAFGPMAAASLGAILFTMANERSRTALAKARTG